MDLFGSFNFSRLIKTFLPGFMLCLSAMAYVDIIALQIANKYILYFFAFESPVLFTVLLIPISIIFGVYSNTFFFALGYELLIFNHFKKKNIDLFNFENTVKEKIKTQLIDEMVLLEEQKESFIKHLDIKSFYLNKLDVDKISFLKDSFWYYLEFQLNILLGLNTLCPAVIFFIIKGGINLSIHWTIITLIIISFFVIIVAVNSLFIKSARKNFKHHKEKYLSLLIGAYYFK